MADAKYIVLLLAVLLAACGGASSDSGERAPVSTMPATFDYVGTYNLRVAYDPGIDYPISPADIEVGYQHVLDCLGVTMVPAPAVRVVAEPFVSDGQLVAGTYDHHRNLVTTINNLYALHHEFAHHVLDRIGHPFDRNRAHDHPIFGDCVVPVLPYAAP